MTQKTYYNRLGNISNPDEASVIEARAGAWLVLVTNDALLLVHPNYAPTVPDLPGGGIDDGETAIEAACRELKEETLLDLDPTITIDKTHTQFVHFHADDHPVFWDYDQTFFLVTQGIDHLYFTEKRKVPEGHCEWINLSDLDKYQILYFHKIALKELNVST